VKKKVKKRLQAEIMAVSGKAVGKAMFRSVKRRMQKNGTRFWRAAAEAGDRQQIDATVYRQMSAERCHREMLEGKINPDGTPRDGGPLSEEEVVILKAEIAKAEINRADAKRLRLLKQQAGGPLGNLLVRSIITEARNGGVTTLGVLTKEMIDAAVAKLNEPPMSNVEQPKET
jgi:hypothetical protein